MEIDYSALRARWEHAVVSNPLVAFRAGPPSWMVREEWIEGKESFHDANERVKARYFNVDGSPKMSNGMSNVQPNVQLSNADIRRLARQGAKSRTAGAVQGTVVSTPCECGKPVAKGTKCWACYKKVSRSK